MNKDEFLEYLNSGKEIESGSKVSKYLRIVSQNAIKNSAELNAGYHEPEEIIEIFEKITDRKIDESFRLFPPFYTECGLNIHIGKNIFINSGCRFQDHGGIYIDDGSFIGHNAVFATLNHNLDPEKRANLIPEPIYVGKNVWIGANVTVLPGVRIGDGAVVAAGAVVTKEVKENTVVAGVPAKFIKNV